MASPSLAGGSRGLAPRALYFAFAVLSGWLVSPLMDISPATQDSFSIMAVALAVIGAMVLLGLVDLARRMVAR